MTAQIDDVLTYRGQDFALVEIEYEPLFEPQQYHLTPHSMSSACWRGFYCVYHIVDGCLQINRLCIGCANMERIKVKYGRGTSLCGVYPVYDERESCLRYEYLALPIAYTGSLIIADEFIQELYVHIGFHPAWKYHTVYELVFRDGVLVEEINRSDEMVAIRARLSQQLISPIGPVWSQDFADWIEQTFGRRYHRLR